MKFNNEILNNPVLQKLIGDKDCRGMELTEKVNLIVNIANVLTSEIENLRNLETTLKNENLAFATMQESLRLKEIDIFELQTEVNRLKQKVNENNIGELRIL